MTNDEKAELERLRDFAMAYANCPCCCEYRECQDGCTFADDCPNEAETQRAARYALYGYEVTK